MTIGLIGKKIGMTREFFDAGISVPVTVLSVEKGRVLDVITKEKRGYNAIQVGFGKIKNSKLTKQMKGVFTKKSTEPKKFLKEFRISNVSDYKEGNEIGLELFKDQKFVDVTAKTIGKGFAGVMKKYNFSGLRATHGVSVSHRSHGSTGQRQDPGKVFKGKKMAGHMGDKLRTIQNLEIIKSGINVYEKIKEEVNEGLRPLHRKKEWAYFERKKKKQNQKMGWYRKGGYEAVLFIPATPDSKLSGLMKCRIREESSIKIKVVEKSGKKIKQILQKNDPLADLICYKPECAVCSTSKKGGCRSSGVTYKVICDSENPCKFSYTGQTGKNGYTRGNEHLEDYRKKDACSVMWKHCQNSHVGKKQKFSMEVVDRCRGDPTKRQILEAIRIKNSDVASSMNDRNEWNFVVVPQATVQ